MTSSSVVNTKNGLNVVTKTNDGGAKAAKRPRFPVRKQEDPFMYYSDQETRMNALLLSAGNGENDEQIAPALHERKTRISFELHPSLLIEDMLTDNDQGLPQDEDDAAVDVVLRNLQRMLRGHGR